MNRRQFMQVGSGVVASLVTGVGLAAIDTAANDTTGKESFAPSNGAALSGIFVVAPSMVKAGEPFFLGVKMLTRPYTVKLNCFSGVYPSMESSTNLSVRGISYMDNVLPEWSGALELESDKDYRGPARFSFAEGAGPYPHDHRPILHIGPVQFTKAGVHFIVLRDPATGVARTSNAILVEKDEPEQRLFWGDIHCHTVLTDGIRSPEEVYYFARDEAFLDVFALSDHAEFYLTDRMWEYFCGVTNDFNCAGRFVTLIGQEWTNFEFGHRNLYYVGNSAPHVRATDPKWSKLAAIYELARAHGALVVPHHPASAVMGVNWSLGHDPEVERLVEIYSAWGNSERSTEDGNPRSIKPGAGGEKKGQHVLDALRLGRRYGILASGDVHDGRPGDTLHEFQKLPPEYVNAQHGGIVGIWAESLSRESIFRALWNRQVYGTTGAQIVLKFSIAGHPMGSQFKHNGALDVRVDVASETFPFRVDLVKNGADLRHIDCTKGLLRWKLEEPPAKEPAFYFVRVTRKDGEMAWSSPIWVEAG
jgi:hypothetical protein